jgi:hypothetical protein
MAEINIERLSRRSFSACNRVTSETESRAFVTTGGAMIERLENTPEIQMRAATRPSVLAVNLCSIAISFFKQRPWLVPHITSIRNGSSVANTKGFGRLTERGTLGSEERKTGSFGGLFHTRGLM